MRWTYQEDYAERVVTKFALFPVSVGGESRWLEWVTVRQMKAPFAGWVTMAFEEATQETRFTV